MQKSFSDAKRRKKLKFSQKLKIWICVGKDKCNKCTSITSTISNGEYLAERSAQNDEDAEDFVCHFHYE